MKLCGSSLSPFFERAYLVAQFKGQPDAVTQSDIPGGYKSEGHFAANPAGKIPILLLKDGTPLSESQVIAEYLDRAIEGPNLGGGTPLEQAQISQLCRFIDVYFIDSFVNLWGNKGADEAKIADVVNYLLPKAMDYLEHYASGEATLFPGKATLAECALIPFIFHMKVFGKAHGFQDFGDRPKLRNWYDAQSQSDIGKASFERTSIALEKMRAARS